MDRTIIGAILTRGRIYKAGDEDLLAPLLPKADIERLVEKGALTGDWGQRAAAPAADPIPDPTAAVEPEPEPAADLAPIPDPASATEPAARATTSKKRS
jgi:hypothetical protein